MGSFLVRAGRLLAIRGQAYRGYLNLTRQAFILLMMQPATLSICFDSASYVGGEFVNLAKSPFGATIHYPGDCLYTHPGEG